MSTTTVEKYWEKTRFAKAEKQYYELLSQDKYFKSDKKINTICKIQQRKVISVKINENKSGCVTSRNNFEASDKLIKFDQKLKKMALGYQQDSSITRKSILVSEIAKAREHIKNSLEKMDGISCVETNLIPLNILERFELLEEENTKLKKIISSLNALCLESQKRISVLEEVINGERAGKADMEDDDGVDLFGSDSDEESEEAARIREERVAAYAAKKSKKPILIAKSSVVLDVKPWDDETDLKEMESLIRKISTEGLLWGASKLAPVAFGINKLSINCVVEDDKVSIDWLTEEIEKNEEFVQSVDVAAFNKI